MTLRLIVLFLAILGLGAENWWLWNKAKNSCIQNVISGASTFQKEQEKVAEADVAQAEADTKTITELRAEINASRTRAKNRQVHPVPKAEGTPPLDCGLPDDALERVREAAGKTRPG